MPANLATLAGKNARQKFLSARQKCLVAVAKSILLPRYHTFCKPVYNYNYNFTFSELKSWYSTTIPQVNRY